MVEKKDRKKKIITTLAVGGSLAIGGSLLARKLLNKKAITPPNNITITKPKSTAPQVTEVIKPQDIPSTKSQNIPSTKPKELVSSKVKEPEVVKDNYVPQRLEELKRRRSDRKKATGEKLPDFPKKPRQQLEVKKRDGLNLPKAPRQNLDVKPPRPELDDIIPRKNELEEKIINTIFPSSKLVGTTKVKFPRKLRFRFPAKTKQGRIRLPQRPRYDVELPVRKPRTLDEATGVKKPVTYEDRIKENLGTPEGAATQKLLPSAPNIPSLGTVVRVKPYKKVVGGKIVSVKGYVRKQNINPKGGVLLENTIDDGMDKTRRETIRRVRQLRSAARRRKEQIEINNLQYEKLLDDQVVNQNGIKLEIKELVKEVDDVFVSTDNNLKTIKPLREKKSYQELIGEISTTKPVVKTPEIDGEFFDKRIKTLKQKVDDVLEGFDYDDKILKEIQVEKINRVDDLRVLRNSQKNLVSYLEKELTKAKRDRKKLNDLVEGYKKDYQTFVKSNEKYEEVLDDLRLKRLELENVSPSSVGKDFYTTERLDLIKEIQRLESGEIKQSGYVREIENKLKELDDKVNFLTKERGVAKEYGVKFNRELNKYERELSNIPTSRFYLKREATRKNEKLNKIIGERVLRTENYLNSVEKDIKKKIDEPLKAIEKEIGDIEKRLNEIDVNKIRNNVEANVKERENLIRQNDFLAEKHLVELNHFLGDENKLKNVILENVPMKGLMSDKLAKGKTLSLEEALELKRKKVEELRRQARRYNNDAYKYGKSKDTPPPEMPHESYLKQVKNELKKNRATLKVKRDNLFSTLDKYNFEEVRKVIKDLKDTGLYAYYKNTNPELYKKILAFEDLLGNKLVDRYRFLLEEVDFRISKIDKSVDFINKELEDLSNIKPRLIINANDTILNQSLSVDGEIRYITSEEFEKRVITRYSKIDDLTKRTRKRETLLPVYEELFRRGFKVEGENSIFNNFRRGKFTPSQKEFIQKLPKRERKFLEQIVEQNLDELSYNFFYLNRLNDVIRKHPPRKTKLKKVRGLLKSLNAIRVQEGKPIKLIIDDESGLLKLSNYESLKSLTNRELAILNDIEKELGINSENSVILENLGIIAKVAKTDLATKNGVNTIYTELKRNNENLTINEYIYLSNIVKDNLRSLSNELYLNNFSDTLELVRF